jgi:hypothetical protein
MGLYRAVVATLQNIGGGGGFRLPPYSTISTNLVYVIKNVSFSLQN